MLLIRVEVICGPSEKSIRISLIMDSPVGSEILARMRNDLIEFKYMVGKIRLFPLECQSWGNSKYLNEQAPTLDLQVKERVV